MLKRLLMTAVLVLTAIATVPQVSEANSRDLCKFQRVDRNEQWSAHENRMTVRCFAKKIGVSVDMALLVAGHESGFNEDAYNPNGHGGLFQQDTDEWLGRTYHYGYLLRRYEVKNHSWHNPRANTVVSLGMAKQSGWGSGWCNWASYC